jgi:membrane protease YdiL (CAAX protease family)
MSSALAIYFALVALLVWAGFIAGGEMVYWQILIPLILLAALVVALRVTGLGRRGAKPQSATGVFVKHLIVFAAAMAARAVFITIFGYPGEKVPVIYLVVLTAFWVEGRSSSDIGVVRWRLGRSLAAGLIIGLIFYGLSNLLYAAGVPLLLGVSPKFSPVSLNVEVVVRAMVMSFVLVALSEELLFRGYFQSGAERAIGPDRAVIYSAVLFGLWHIAWGIPFSGEPMFALVYALSYAIFAFLSGIVLATTYRSTASIAPSTMVHGIWNTLAILIPVSSTSQIFLGDVWRSLSFGLTILFLFLIIPRIIRLFGVERAQPW